MIKEKTIVLFILSITLVLTVAGIFYMTVVRRNLEKTFNSQNFVLGEPNSMEIPAAESTATETPEPKAVEEQNVQAEVKDANDSKEESEEKETTRLELSLKKDLELLLDAIEGKNLNDIDNCLSVSITCYGLLAKAYGFIEEKVPEQTKNNFQSIFRYGFDYLESESEWGKLEAHEKRIEALGFPK